MIRKNIYSIEDTLNILKPSMFGYKKNFIIFDGEEIKANSQRYQVFMLKGCTCCKRGLQAQYFALEKHEDQNRYHLNLYGIDKQGKEILFTKDHIIPVSKGGKNVLDNYQPMCISCNEEKNEEKADK